MRLAETNLNGSLPVRRAILGIRGVGNMLSAAVSSVSGLGDKTMSSLSPEEMKKLGDVLANPEKHGIPTWMLNRRFDPFTGEDKHLLVSKLQFAQKKDIDEMRKFKTYKGVRHSQHLPVRGQRTRGAFRKGKTVGVKKKKAAPAKAKK